MVHKRSGAAPVEAEGDEGCAEKEPMSYVVGALVIAAVIAAIHDILLMRNLHKSCGGPTYRGATGNSPL